MFTRTLLFISAVTLTLAAQPLITIRPAPDQTPRGITIRTPSNLSFQDLVEKFLLPPAAIPLYQRVLPYATVIGNEASTPVIAMTLTIQITDANGRTSGPLMYHLGSIPPGKESVVLAPGREFLFTADPRFTQLAPLLSNFDVTKQKERLDELASRPLERYISARAIMLALDSVLFSDGTVAGPDEANAFEMWTKALQMQAKFDNDVLAFQGRGTEELRQYLTTVAATPSPQSQRHSWGLPDTQCLAFSYERMLRNKGPETVFRVLKHNVKATTSLTIHR